MREKQPARTFLGSARHAAGRTGRARAEGVKRFAAGDSGSGWRSIVSRKWLARALLLAGVFALAAGVITAWGREQLMAGAGRIARETRVVRLDFQIEDLAATADRRALARTRAPRVYRTNQAVIQEIESSLQGLPATLADAGALDQVALKIREDFGLTQERLDAIRQYVKPAQGEGGARADEAWSQSVAELMRGIRAAPAVDRETYQLEQQQPNSRVELRAESGDPISVRKELVVNVESEQFKGAMAQAVETAGFKEPVASVIVERLIRAPLPTYFFDRAASEEVRDKAAAGAQRAMATQPAGRMIVARGDRIDEEAMALLIAENRAFLSNAPAWRLWLPRTGALAAAALVTGASALYIALFCARMRERPSRLLTVTGLGLITLAAATLGAAFNPPLVTLVATAPTVFFAMVLVTAFDQRRAAALSTLHAILVCLAIDQSPGFFATMMAGAIIAVWRLREIRQRNSLIYAGLVSGAAMAVTTLVGAALELPITGATWRQAMSDSLWAGASGVLVGFVALGLLPVIERVFDVTTAMTLVELRDPKQPLLRELQRRAPGTYQHSFAVAGLAETAADAIGADGLHVYVGALYHDIGKINKPDYFVENQAGPFSRHEKLSPAMSLLVIVGHVKDGVELAREHRLPRSLHHYIESHHGTTLVQYFYHAAQQKAEEADADHPQEIEYRYPGPKPRTRESAILMLCDAVEGATRAMSDPTPSRIEALVHDIAHRRLMDGQFDEADLTLRELHIVENAVTKTLCSIYHGRITYPASDREADDRPATRAPTAPAVAPASAPAEKTA